MPADGHPHCNEFLVALRFWIWCAAVHTGALTKLLESLTSIEVLRDYALQFVSVLSGLEWIKKALRLPLG
jgi:hypothetical protein